MSRFPFDKQWAAVLVPDEAIKDANLAVNDGAPGNSSYTQAGRHPGVPTYDRDEVAITSTTAGNLGPHMALEATGDQADVSYHVKVLKGGMPGDQAEVVYRPSLDNSEMWRGYQTHNVIEWDNIDYDYNREVNPASGSVNYDSVRTADDQVLFISSKKGAVKCRKYDPATHTAGPYVTIVAETPTLSNDTTSYAILTTCLVVAGVVLPTGRILVYALTSEVYASTNGDQTLWVHYSDDHGASWRSGNYLAIDTLIDLASDTPLKMRAGYSNESVLLLIERENNAASPGIFQFASDDMGMNFRLIEDWEGPAAHPDLVVDPATGAITVFYYDDVSALRYRRISSPFSPLSAAPADIIASNDPTNIACYDDVDGTLYVTWNVNDLIGHSYSRDGGASWATFASCPFNTVTSNQIDAWMVSGAQGRAIWAVANTGGGINDHTFVFIESGGWTTLCQPRHIGREPHELHGFGDFTGSTWIPTDTPDTCGWTLTGAGATLATAAPYGVNISTAGATTYYQKTGSHDPEDGYEAFFGLHFVSGSGSLTASDTSLTAAIGNGTRNIRVTVRFTPTQVRVIDLVSSITLGTVALDTLTSRKVFKLAMRVNPAGPNGQGALYCRDPGSDEWTALITGTLAIDVSALTSTITWGHAAASTNATRWSFFHDSFTTGEGGPANYYYYDDLSRNTLTNAPYSLYGRRLPSSPYRAWLDQGLYLHGTSGPAVRGDTWRVVPDYDYPVSNLNLSTSASPARKWRSEGTATQRIVWIPDGGNLQGFGSTSYGAAIFGANFPTATFQGWNGATWINLSTIDFAEGLSNLYYTRSGNTIIVDPSGMSGATKWIGYNELAGATFQFNNGQRRRIRSNSEGAWTNAITKRPTLILEGVDGTEPASGTAGAIWLPDAVGLIHQGTTAYSRYGIEIPSSGTVDGHFTMGTVVVGAAAIFANAWSRSRSVETAANYELYTGTSGARTARKLGPARRIIEHAHVEGYDTKGTQRQPPSPDFVSIRSGSVNAVAARGDATLLEGIVRRTGGAVVPVVYLPRIPATEAAGVNYTRLAGREHVVLGRLTGTVAREQVLGWLNSDEVQRVTGFTLEEEV